MSLRLRINLIVGALTTLFVLAVMTLQWRALRDAVHEEVVAANRVAGQLLHRTAWVYAKVGTAGMRDFLQGLGRIRANDVTLVDGSGRELYRSPRSPYKAGRDAPDWFAALISPAPAVQSIAFPDGRLEVRANASRATLDAWDDMVWLMGGALALLVSINALVFWLVGRTTRPFGQIVAALNQVQARDLAVALPALPGREAAAIGAAFNRMVGEMRHHLDTERRAVRAELQLSDSRELTRWIDQHIEQERRLIARELHDELGQSVTAMRSLALSIAQRAGATDAPTEQAARVIAEEASRLYEAMHGLIPRLTPLVLDNFGLAEALADLVERTRRSQPETTITTEIDLPAAGLPAEAALTLYRAAQEGITNALRHGAARRLSLRVQSSSQENAGPPQVFLRPLGGPGRARPGPWGCSEAVELSLRDDGRGLPPEGWQRAGHYGLRWLAERVQGLHGELRIEPVSPQGVELRVYLPLAPPSLENA